MYGGVGGRRGRPRLLPDACDFSSSCLHVANVACYRSVETTGERQMDDYQEELLERDAFDQDVTEADDATEL